jgi:GcrA cell cycle regulator
MAPRVSSGAMGGPIGGGGGGGGSARTMRGNTALALMPDTVMEAQPQRIEEDVVVPMSLRVSIVDLKESMCRWPLGDPTSAEFRYCGSQAPGSGPYCAQHGKMAYQPVQDRRRERDRERRALIAR